MKFRALFSVNGLSLDRLRALVEVDDAGNIASVAPMDRNRQSLLSRQIGELERFFETTLKRTEGRVTRLTAEGKQLAAMAREHLQSLDGFRMGVKKQPMTVTLAAGGALLQWVILPRMPRLREAAGNTIWQLHPRKNAVMCQQLLDGSLDFGLLRSDLLEKYQDRGGRKNGDLADRSALVGTPLGTVSYSVFVPDTVCPRARALPLKAILADLPIATQGDDTTFQLKLETALAKRKWRMSPALYSESFTQVAQMVAGGTMTGILPDIAADSFDSTKVWSAPLAPLADLRREISLAWNPGRHERLPVLARSRPSIERVLRF